MNFFKQFAQAVQAGVVFRIAMRAAGEGRMQLELLPEANTAKTGIVLPPKVFVATAEEFDNEIPDFLKTYLVATMQINEQIQAAGKEMDAAVEAAKASAAAKAEARKAASANSPTKSLTKSVPGLAVKKNRSVSLDDDDGSDDDDLETDQDDGVVTEVNATAQDPVAATETDTSNFFL